MADLHRLKKSNTDKVIAGVAGGLGDYLDVDPVVIRIAFVVLCFITLGFAFVIYIAMAVLMPRHATTSQERLEDAGGVSEGQAEEADGFVERSQERRERTRSWFAMGLVALGGAALASNFELLGFVDWGLLWPVTIIVLRAGLLFARVRAR